jgi:cell division protein FtsX
MAVPLAPVAHHSESVDPTLWKWIQHQIDVTTGLSAIAIVIILGIIVVAIPVIVIIFAIRSKKYARSRVPADDSDDHSA